MEWRIIVPVLCLIGMLHVPGNAAQGSSTTTIVYRFTLRFSINATFQSDYSNNTNNLTQALINNITSQVQPLYKDKYTNFQRFDSLKFSNGSIVTEGELQFSSGSKPNVTDLAQVLTNGSFTFTIITNSTNIAEVTAPAATTPATTATTTTAPAPAKVAKIRLVFKLFQDFKNIYSNLSHPETTELTNNITTACSQVYRSRYPNFYRMVIQKYSNGSIVTDSVLEFNTTSPDATEVKNTLIAAIANGNFSFKIDNTSISATVITEIDSSLKEYNITFKMNQTFTNDLSNMSSDGATKLAKNVTTELDGLYKTFKDFVRTLVWQFRNGSIDVDALLGFNKSSNNLPSVSVLARTLADAVRTGTVKLPIDPKTIKVTDPVTGDSANSAPVLASMLTAVWMTLASLLLSAVMH